MGSFVETSYQQQKRETSTIEAGVVILDEEMTGDGLRDRENAPSDVNPPL